MLNKERFWKSKICLLLALPRDCHPIPSSPTYSIRKQNDFLRKTSFSQREAKLSNIEDLLLCHFSSHRSRLLHNNDIDWEHLLLSQLPLPHKMFSSSWVEMLYSIQREGERWCRKIPRFTSAKVPQFPSLGPKKSSTCFELTVPFRFHLHLCNNTWFSRCTLGM